MDELDYSQDKSERAASPIQIPPESLSAEALSGVIENFIVREGTDYGAVEIYHETKIKQIHSQIEKGDVKIVFDPATESVTLLTKREWEKLESKIKGEL